ncbi:MAG: efflux RND transporter periplasmic adaptor subunit [Pontiellaceae bacterium]|nr:efflux RND transporter periplasmic adaptor subunit [Pontiellaceae bacterium]MBN2784790.1 efflux RND transporter periplasmic adaptor subunit [Pontiellaceae bacterium]
MKNKSGSIQILLVGTVVLLAVLVAILMIFKPAEKPEETGSEAAVAVATITVQPTNTPDVVLLPALIEANVDVTLSAEKAGRIVALKVDRGDAVKKAQLLMQIDDRIWQTNLKQARIAAANAERNFERTKSLMESGAVSQSDYDAAEKAYIQTTSTAEEARINIEQCRVESPIDGIVNDRFVEEGEYVQPGTPLFQVIDRATVRVIVQIPEKDIFSIRLGDRIRFSVQPLEDRTFEGEVTFVAAQADRRNNAFRSDITVDNSDAVLRPGMIAQIEFNRGSRGNMVSLPMAAVLPSKGEHIVYLAQDGQAVRRRVQIDTIARTHALISSGLETGDQVIIEGNRTLSDGQRIEVINTGNAAQ